LVIGSASFAAGTTSFVHVATNPTSSKTVTTNRREIPPEPDRTERSVAGDGSRQTGHAEASVEIGAPQILHCLIAMRRCSVVYALTIDHILE
jgi:hypothetical protein